MHWRKIVVVLLILLTVSVVYNINLVTDSFGAEEQKRMWVENYRVAAAENRQLKLENQQLHQSIATLQREIQKARATNNWRSVISLLGTLLLP